MRSTSALITLVVSACAVPAAPPPAKVWTTASMLAAGPGKSFGGFDPARLAVKQGAPVAWRTTEFRGTDALAAADALVVQPAYFDGRPAAYVITEIWQGHPDPWVQPIYRFVKPFVGSAPQASPTADSPVFGVGTDSTFYSPYWRVWWTVPPDDGEPPYDQVAKLTTFETHRGPMVVCPIVPRDVALETSLHPFTAARLVAPGNGAAWVNGEKVTYLGLGIDRQAATQYENETDGRVSVADLYVFVRVEADGTRTLLELPPVLPEDALHHSFVRRVDVVLSTEAVFVPADLASLAQRVREQGLDVPAADPAIAADVASAHLLRVAKNGKCFASAATFPTACAWLDSEAALEDGIDPQRIIETDVTLAATMVPFE